MSPCGGAGTAALERRAKREVANLNHAVGVGAAHKRDEADGAVATAESHGIEERLRAARRGANPSRELGLRPTVHAVPGGQRALGTGSRGRLGTACILALDQRSSSGCSRARVLAFWLAAPRAQMRDRLLAARDRREKACDDFTKVRKAYWR